jgi:adenylate kinase family enzyme
LKPRIHVLGGPGSGKSYVAAKLARHFGVPAYDLDDLFWDRPALNYGLRADPENRDRQLAMIVSRDGWIIEGVYYEWLAPSFKAADVIIALTPSVWIRHRRVIKRFLLRRLGSIPSKRESLTDLWCLLRWSHGYDRKNFIQAREFMAVHGRKPVNCKTFDEVMAAAENLAAGSI